MKQIFVLLLAFGYFAGGNLQAEPKRETVSQWKLADFSNGRVPNEIDHGGPLSATPEAEFEVAGEGDFKGLRFGGKGYLTGHTKEMPGLQELGTGGFGVRLHVLVEDHPEGIYAGLFQAMKYEVSGFRLVLRKNDLRLAVEYVVGGQQKTLIGATSLVMGTPGIAEVRFQEGEVVLLVNEAEDARAPLEGTLEPYAGQFSIGRASGAGYDFRGILGEVTVYQIDP